MAGDFPNPSAETETSRARAREFISLTLDRVTEAVSQFLRRSDENPSIPSFPEDVYKRFVTSRELLLNRMNRDDLVTVSGAELEELSKIADNVIDYLQNLK